MKGQVLIISYYNFPDGDAGSLRHETFAKLFRTLEYEPIIIAMGKRKEDKEFEIKEFNTIKYTTLRIKKSGIVDKLKNYFGFKRRLKKFLKNNQLNIKAILLTDLPINAYLYIKKYAIKHKIVLLHDCVEWYSPEQFKRGKWSIEYIKKNLINSKIIDKNIKVIAITNYLYKYFNNKKISSTVIPVILDIQENKNYKKMIEGKKIYIYAGSPGKKDNLDIMLKGFALLPEEKINEIIIRLYGVTEEDVKKIITENEYDKLCSALKCFGRVKREIIMKSYKEVTFSILMRNPKLKYAQAGFPTKVVESMMNYTPVITNITSDLDKYLENKKNSVIVQDFSKESFCNAILESTEMTTEQLKEMQSLAHNTAKEKFSYENYKDKLQDLLKGESNE